MLLATNEMCLSNKCKNFQKKYVNVFFFFISLLPERTSAALLFTPHGHLGIAPRAPNEVRRLSLPHS